MEKWRYGYLAKFMMTVRVAKMIGLQVTSLQKEIITPMEDSSEFNNNNKK